MTLKRRQRRTPPENETASERAARYKAIKDRALRALDDVASRFASTMPSPASHPAPLTDYEL